ncbi:hypothetical protein HAX54_021113 [Datura stramonium]|uniref:Nudix hydrolase domain-containing protein n=1 Tax=Datura stramonium TaxID=4076 RepID=A0ABS8S6I6_DATST|nr:hypothetical protein [Datura stramonium]
MASNRSENLMKLAERLRVYNSPCNHPLGLQFWCVYSRTNKAFRVISPKEPYTPSYSGEVALPGGKVEEGDANDIETALREAEEEIGLDRSLRC